MRRLYGWHILPEDIVPVPGIIPGFNLASRAFGAPGAGVVVQAPTFYPISRDVALHDMVAQEAPLRRFVDARNVYFSYDPNVFEAAFDDQSKIATVCHPHNPTGHVFGRDELLHMAQTCVDRRVVICSDEIHCDIRLDASVHIPIASLSDTIAQQCVTLMSPSKAFNIPGLVVGFAIIQNPRLRERYVRAQSGMIPHPNAFAYAATLAAYQEGDAWLAQANVYYAANRDYALAYVQQHMPQLRCTIPMATYLLWIDARELKLPGSVRDFFARYGVALGDGTPFGGESEGFVRMTLACPRSVLAQALDAMRVAVATL
jgi:cystathionine beta-lyase